jgi:hypothetical protein
MKAATGQGFYADAAQAPSADAEALLKIITGTMPKVNSVTLSEGLVAVQAGDTLTLTAQAAVENTEGDTSWEELTWSIDPVAPGRFADGVFTPDTGDAEKWFTIKAASKKDPSKFAECKVYVSKAAQSIIKGNDGYGYIYYISDDDNTYQRVNNDGTLGALVCPVTVGKPGYPATDRTNIYTAADGKHYLDNADGSYYGVGTDGKLGTGDDVLHYKNSSGVMKPFEAAITLTTTASKAVMLLPNETVELTASAMYNEASVDASVVTWSLINGTYASGTTLSAATGNKVTLAVDVKEVNSTITIRATHPGTTATNSAYQDITINIKLPVGATSYTDSSGIVWRVLKDNRVGALNALDGSASNGDGTMLLLTDRAYSNGDRLNWTDYNTSYNSTNEFRFYEQTTGTYRPSMNLWYTNFVSSELKALACIPNLEYEATVPTSSWSATWNENGAISTPGLLAGTQTTEVTFPLSISEVNRYLGTTNATRGAVDSAGNGENTAAHPYRSWRLRSPGNSATSPSSSLGPTSIVSSDGGIYGVRGTWTDVMRPAMWIDTTP